VKGAKNVKFAETNMSIGSESHNHSTSYLVFNANGSGSFIKGSSDQMKQAPTPVNERAS